MKIHLRAFRHPVPIAAFLALGLLAPVTQAQDPLKNGGFEEGIKSWWGPGARTGGVDVSQPGEGSQSLKLTSDFICQDKITVSGGQKYKISMKIRTEDAPEGSVYVQLSYRGGGLQPGWHGPETASVEGRMEKSLYPATGGTSDWKNYSTVVQTPESASEMLIYLRKVPASGGAAYFDDIRVESTQEAATKAKAPPLPPDGQVIVNGGFENGTAGWWGGAIGKTGGVVEGSATEGAKSLKVTGDFACQDKRPVEEGKRYRISMKIRSEDAPEGSGYVQISFRGDGVGAGWTGPARVDLGRAEPALFVTGGNHDWKEFSAVVEAPPLADQILVYLRKKSGTGGAVYYDEVSMLPTSEPVTTAGDLRREELAADLLAAPLPEAQAQALREAAAAAGKTPASGPLKLAENGEARYRIHVGAKASVIALNAARELAEYLGRISGGHFLPLSHDSHPLSGPLVVVGRDNALTAELCPDIPYEELGEDGFVIRTVGPHIVIAGNTPGGTMYGVNWFLDHKLGVKWLSPDYTHIPAIKTIEVAELNEKQVPRFTFRQILSHEGQDKPFAARNLLNGNSHGAYSILPKPEINHWDNSWQRPGLTASFYDLMPPKEYQKKHPDWFAGGQVAMMNPEVRTVMANAIIKRLKGVPNYGNYWFGFMDNDWGWDMDAKSAAFAREHGNAPSAPRVNMAIDVTEQVRRALPDARIAINAYHWSFTPPTGLTVPDDILVYPMTIHVDYSSPLNKGRNEQLGRDIAGWNAIAKTILLWDHITNFHGFIQPTPNIYPIGESIQWLAGLENIFGYFAEGSWNTPGAEFASLRVWLMARVLWDPKTDIHAAVSEYCDAYFGPAGRIVNQYIDLMHAEAARTRSPIWEKTNVDSPLLNFDFITQADRLMEQAEAAAKGDPVFLRHVRQVRLSVDYVVLLRRKEFETTARTKGVTWSADTAGRRARFDETVATEKITQYRQGGKNTDELAVIMDIERKDSQPPALVKELPASDWKEIQDLGINRYYKPTIIVADETASDGAAARLDGNSEAWVIQTKMHLVPEEGEWDIYAEVRVDADGAADSDTALCIGAAPPMGRFTKIPFSQVKGEGYHLVKVPGGPFRYNGDDGAISYIKGPNSSKIKHIYVDRFFMVRAK